MFIDKYCLLTNDVETTSIINHRLDDNTAKYVWEEGMPRLLELYERYNVKATFFYTADISMLIPDVVRMILPYGHEVGSHGYTHEVKEAFDVLPFEKQKEHLKKSKEILEDISGQEVISFRAPAARVNQNTAKALIETGFRVDSSVASQRLDMFMSFGALKKMNWLTSPRLPYFTSINNIFKKGESNLLEIPISAFGFPYIGTFMRISPSINRLTRYLLHLETKVNSRPIVFLTHPNEFIDETRDQKQIERRGINYVSYLLGDLLRHRLKIKNLGFKAIPLLERELKFFEDKKYNFITCKEYYNSKIKEK
ncbi:MAG: polysaccharide deacetylase family protein [Ignavibacteriaceae bacterium]|nr:polysaccharide deacetylase family protein [Ignavibacteriaceae bacterium]